MVANQQYDDNYWDEDDDSVDARDSKQFRELRKADRAKAARIKELEERLSTMSKAVRDRSVKDVLTARGLNPKIAAFIPADIESSEEAIAKWVDEYGDVFGASQSQTQQQQPADEGIPGVTTPGTLDPNIQTMTQNAQVSSSGQAFTGDVSQLESLIASASTPEELNQLLFGNPNGPQAF